jgi:hypothetical protein
MVVSVSLLEKTVASTRNAFGVATITTYSIMERGQQVSGSWASHKLPVAAIN